MEKENLEKVVDGIAVETTNQGEAIKGLVTKEEFGEFKNENFTRLDNMMAVLQRLDQERVFTINRIRPLEEDIDKIKAQLALS